MSRRIDFEGCYNFRDLGGYATDDGRTVRWGRLYRADSVHLMTPGDCTRLSDLGVRTLIDLRSPREIELGGVPKLPGTARHHLPFGASGVDSTTGRVAADADRSTSTMSQRYRALLEISADLVTDAVEAIASEDALPAVFFCIAGKDRTGVLAAVVLGALGVRDEDIVSDYAMTADAIEPIIRRLASVPDAPAMYRDNPPSHFAPHAETMESLLDWVAADYGSMSVYLESKGVSRETLDRLRSVLLE